MPRPVFIQHRVDRFCTMTPAHCCILVHSCTEVIHGYCCVLGHSWTNVSPNHCCATMYSNTDIRWFLLYDERSRFATTTSNSGSFWIPRCSTVLYIGKFRIPLLPSNRVESCGQTAMTSS